MANPRIAWSFPARPCASMEPRSLSTLSWTSPSATPLPWRFTGRMGPALTPVGPRRWGTRRYGAGGLRPGSASCTRTGKTTTLDGDNAFGAEPDRRVRSHGCRAITALLEIVEHADGAASRVEVPMNLFCSGAMHQENVWTTGGDWTPDSAHELRQTLFDAFYESSDESGAAETYNEHLLELAAGLLGVENAGFIAAPLPGVQPVRVGDPPPNRAVVETSNGHQSLLWVEKALDRDSDLAVPVNGCRRWRGRRRQHGTRRPSRRAFGWRRRFTPTRSDDAPVERNCLRSAPQIASRCAFVGGARPRLASETNAIQTLMSTPENQRSRAEFYEEMMRDWLSRPDGPEMLEVSRQAREVNELMREYRRLMSPRPERIETTDRTGPARRANSQVAYDDN